MEMVVSRVQEGSMAEHCSTLVQSMAHLPGWAEKNFQVRVCCAHVRVVHVSVCVFVCACVCMDVFCFCMEHCSTLVQSMAHLPGWAEKNFQVCVV